MTTLPAHQIRALVRLLADGNARVARTVRAQILELGPRAVPYLDEVLGHQDGGLQEEARLLLARIRQEEAVHRFREFASGPVDLEEGVFLFAQTAYPDLKVEAYRQRLDLMARELGGRLDAITNPDEVLQAINHYLFVELGFRGDTADYSNPENSYVNRVLDRRLGIPISLSVVYLLVSRRLNLPIMGVGMPAHFLVAYRTGGQARLLDPFNAGRVLSREDCARFLAKAGYGWREDYLEVSTDRETLARMIRNLIASHTQLGDTAQVERLTVYLQVLTV